jgi:hypothetical protein
MRFFLQEWYHHLDARIMHAQVQSDCARSTFVRPGMLAAPNLQEWSEALPEIHKIGLNINF